MSVVLVDTSVWISYLAGSQEKALDDALKEDRVYLSPLVAAELLSGRLSAQQRRNLKSFLEELPLCETSLDHWFRVGELRSNLFRRGLSVSTPDAHITECALQLQAELMSKDKIFSKIARAVPLLLG